MKNATRVIESMKVVEDATKASVSISVNDIATVVEVKAKIHVGQTHTAPPFAAKTMPMKANQIAIETESAKRSIVVLTVDVIEKTQGTTVIMKEDEESKSISGSIEEAILRKNDEEASLETNNRPTKR